MPKAAEISDIKGKKLSAVCFVHDYVEFHFDGTIIRAFSLPEIIVKNKKISKNDEGWRDTLCNLISQDVAGIFLDNDYFRLNLSDGAIVVISLNPDGFIGEVMHFVPARNAPIQVW